MWYEILPSAFIISFALALPIHASYGLNKLFAGNGFRRMMDDRFSRVMYQRDGRIAGGNPYQMNGLDSIPDEPKKKRSFNVNHNVDVYPVNNNQ